MQPLERISGGRSPCRPQPDYLGGLRQRLTLIVQLHCWFRYSVASLQNVARACSSLCLPWRQISVHLQLQILRLRTLPEAVPLEHGVERVLLLPSP